MTENADAAPGGFLKLSRLYRMQGKEPEALRELELGYRRNRTSAGLLTELVRTYIRQEKHEAAAAVCKERIAENPGDVHAYNLLGRVWVDLKLWDDAEDALQKAIELQPLWPVSHANLARLYLARGLKNEAIARFEAAIRSDPKHAAAYLSLALLYEREKDYRSAMDVYGRALDENPRFWFAANNLAFLISETSNEKQALTRAATLAENALKQRPNDPAILDTLGWVHFRRGDLKQARVLIEQALAAAGDSALMSYHYGAVLLKAGDEEDARRKLEKALEGDSDFPGRAEAEKMLRDMSA
jgi:tetratricopeptide (TPR) repeat protein